MKDAASDDDSNESLRREQAGTIEFLASALARRDGSGPVSRAETHISVILLCATLAWKLKKAVKLPYLDFRSADDRLALCERELALNRRTAPSLYRTVRRVVRDADGNLALDAHGDQDGRQTLVEAVLEMQRFDEADVLDRMAVRGELTPEIVTQLARVVADFHSRAARARELARSGAQRVGDILAINEKGLAMARELLDGESVQRLVDETRSLWQRHRGLLDDRQRSGRVRLCHGDLHLRNIVAIEGTPTLFDCLEFDTGMATTDILYDLAFVLMDLWHRELHALANLMLNRYLDEIDETAGLPLLGLFMAMRATVRAHVTATQASDTAGAGEPATRRDAVLAESRAYLALARRLLENRPARLIAIGGLSGSGKSTAAAAIASAIGAPPGARILSSDRVRKHLHGVAPQTRLPEQAYRPAVSARVYTLLQEQAAAALATGHSVIVDAVFDRPQERERIEAVAADAGVAFHGIWLEAPAAVLLERVDKRRADPSDADGAVVRRQLERNVGPLDWRRVDASSERARTMLRRLLE